MAGFLSGVLVIVAALLALTQTPWGQARVLAFMLGAVEGGMRGEITVERVRGNLLTGARLYQVAVVDTVGDTLIRADSAFLQYSLRTLVSGDVSLSRIRLFGAEATLRRLPGDTVWNYQKMFPPPDEPGPPRATILERVELLGGTFLLQIPWAPAQGLSPTERERAISAALSGESRLLVSRAPGGFLRTLRFSDLDAVMPKVQIGPDTLGGTYLEVEEFRGRVQIWRDPIRVHALSGELALSSEVLEFRASPIRLPSSRLSAFGVMRMTDTPPPIDVTFGGEEVAFKDLQWLYPRLPDQGGGTLVLTIETRPEGTLYLARELDVTAPGTRLRGDFGIVIGDSVHFAGVDLAADPLDLSTIEELLPEGLPVRGLEIGTVRARSTDR